MIKFPFHKLSIEVDEDDKELFKISGFVVTVAVIGSIIVVLSCIGLIEVIKHF